MADALRDGLRRADLPKGMADQVTLARIGGDEIGLILPASMNGEQQQKLLKEIDSIRLGLTVDNADHVTVRRLAPGDTLKAGEVDIGVAAGIAGVETARSEGMKIAARERKGVDLYRAERDTKIRSR